MYKQKASICDWDIVFTGDKNTFALIGKIQNHPRQNEFKEGTQITSPLLKIDFIEGVAETVNTIYTLKGDK